MATISANHLLNGFSAKEDDHGAVDYRISEQSLFKVKQEITYQE